MPLTMATITDDQMEDLLRFVRMIASLDTYDGAEQGEDAMDCMNQLIEWAQRLVD